MKKCHYLHMNQISLLTNKQITTNIRQYQYATIESTIFLKLTVKNRLHDAKCPDVIKNPRLLLEMQS